jgi:hypothetical protein
MKKIELNNTYEVSYNSSSSNKYYISTYTQSVFINESISSDVINLIKKLKQQPIVHTIDKGDNIYTGQLSELPRFKLKEFIKKSNSTRTSKLEYANVVILSKKIFKELISDFKIKKILFYHPSIYNKIINGTNKSNYNNRHTALLKSIDQKRLLFTETKNDINISDEGNSETVDCIMLDVYRNKKLIYFIEILEYILNNKKVKVIFDEDLISNLNKEGIALDDDYEEILKNMILSDDASNVKLGVEMISNLELNDDTVFRISLILNTFIQNKKKTHITKYAQSNKNFKTLLNLIKSKNIFWEREWTQFGAGLKQNFTSPEHALWIKNFVIDNINNEFKERNASSLKVEDIKFAKR